jgi:pyruvate/2-oxoglutarate dehydrogenase complex dihydrolipoamide dehydrogenase (E3) component
MAIGRDPNPDSFGANKAKIEIDKNSRKILGRDNELERTNIDHIYAVGDIVKGVPELMPVAQKSGKLLAHRISLRNKPEVNEALILK